MQAISTAKSQALWKKAKKLIPGGTQLLSKRAEMFLPSKWPAYFKTAKGIEVIDLDGNKFLDFSIMGVGSAILGYADPDVNRAVKKVIDEGSMSTLNSPEEVELTELLIKLHPWADMARFARTGGEAGAIAVRIARAYTKKDKVAICGYHGWHDWYLAANLSGDKNLDGHLLPGLNPLGVPRGLLGTALTFEFNKIDQLKKLVKDNDIGVIIMEPMRHQAPEKGFLEEVRRIADKTKAVLIFDEISSGFRLNVGGIHKLYKVTPDLAIFGKAFSNGFPMSAVIGKRKIMDVAQESFISTTYATERTGPAATIATINKMLKLKVPSHINKIGKLIGDGWIKLSKKHGLDITVKGPNSLINFSFNYENANALKTLFIQEMLKRGYLAYLTVYVCYSHKENQVQKYLKSVDEVFAILKKAFDEKNVEKLIEGPQAHTGFKRLT